MSSSSSVPPSAPALTGEVRSQDELFSSSSSSADPEGDVVPSPSASYAEVASEVEDPAAEDARVAAVGTPSCSSSLPSSSRCSVHSSKRVLSSQGSLAPLFESVFGDIYLLHCLLGFLGGPRGWSTIFRLCTCSKALLLVSSDVCLHVKRYICSLSSCYTSPPRGVFFGADFATRKLAVSCVDLVAALADRCATGDVELVKDMLVRCPPGDPSCYSKFFGSPINIAAEYGHVEVARVLLDAGAKVDTQVGFPTLMRATLRGHLEMARFLIASGADVNTPSPDGKTALMIASVRGHAEIARILIDARADVNAADVEGETALKHAACNNRSEVVKVLIDARADLGMDEDPTALTFAAMCGYADVVRELLRAETDPNRTDSMGHRPLWDAAHGGHLECVTALIDAGAEVDFFTGNNLTALQISIYAGHLECALALIRAGADMDLPNKKGKTAWDYAKKNKKIHREITSALGAGAQGEV